MMRLICFLCVSFLICSCSSRNKIPIQNSKSLVEVMSTENVILLDVRKKEASLENRIENSINIPLSELSETIFFLQNRKNIVVFCEKGKQAEKAIQVLMKNKIDSVYYGKTWKNIKAIQNLKTDK